MSRTGRDCLVTVVDSELIVDGDKDTCHGDEDSSDGQWQWQRVVIARNILMQC